MDAPSLGKATSTDLESQALIAADVKTAQWMKDQVAAEILKIKKNGANAIPMNVTNMCIVREKKHVINRVEMDTKFDFDKVKHILVSDSVECPYKEGFTYVNVLMFTEAPMPMIIPYLYQKEKANRLTEWLFINADAARSRHHVDFN